MLKDNEHMQISLNNNLDKQNQNQRDTRKEIITDPDYTSNDQFGRAVRNSTALPNLAYGISKHGNLASNVSLPAIKKQGNPTRNSIDVPEPHTRTFGVLENQDNRNDYLSKNKQLVGHKFSEFKRNKSNMHVAKLHQLNALERRDGRLSVNK